MKKRRRSLIVSVVLVVAAPVYADQHGRVERSRADVAPVRIGAGSIEIGRDGRITLRVRGSRPASTGRSVRAQLVRHAPHRASQAAAEEPSDNAADELIIEAAADVMDTGEMLTSAALEFRLLAGEELPVPDIGIDPTARVPRLLGAVSDEAAKHAVAVQAMEVVAVGAINNEVQVLSEWAPSAYLVNDDEHVQQRVARALLGWPELHAADIEVTVQQGITTLTGAVPSMDQRALASTVAESTPGVSVLQNRLSLRPE